MHKIQHISVLGAVLALSLSSFATAQTFTIECESDRLPVINQDNTGTCWSYATTSFFESELQRIHNKPIDLSEMFMVYNAYQEKSKRFVLLQGKAQFSEGGLSHDLLSIVKKYGVVPQKDYDGLNGAKRHNHKELATILKAMVETLAKSKRPSANWPQAIRGVLNAYLGAPPASIEVDGKSMTPVEYAQHLHLPINDYRQVMSYKMEPFWQEAELLVPDNWMRYQDYWNLPLDAMMENLDNALRAGYTVAVDIDVSEPDAGGKDVWVLSKELEKKGAVTDAMRQQMFDSKSTTDDHLMHIVGIAHHKDGRQFYLTKNSWGARGKYKGNHYISRNYLCAKMLSYMVHKDGLVVDTRKRLSD